MWSVLTGLDRFVARTRPIWRWLGQLALVALGAHLACDHLDDLLILAFRELPLAWPDPETPARVATWGAVAAELTVVVWTAWAMARTIGIEASGGREWVRRWSVHALLAPMAWLPLALAGCWSIGMATEDAVAEHAAAAGAPVAWVVAGLVAWRLGATGLVALVRQTPVPRHRREGWVWVPVVVPIAVLAWRYGVPVWGLL